MKRDRKKAFRIVFGVIIALVWSGLLFCAMEVYERVRWRRIQISNEFVLEEQSKHARFTQAFSDSLWEEPWSTYKKNQEVTFDFNGKRFQIKTNNLGLRDHFVVIPKPKGLFRILCVGGSTTVAGWTNETTYPNLLEKRLKDTFPDVSLEVINCGVSGLNSNSELEKIGDYLALNPDLILEYNAVNDICWLYFPYLEKNTKGWRRLLRKSRFLNARMNWNLLPGEYAIRTYLENTTIKNLLALHDAAAVMQVPVVFCSFSRPDLKLLNREEREFLECDLQQTWRGKYVTLESYCRMVDIYNRSLRDSCERKGITYIPVAENHHGGLNYFIDICHGTDEGIEKKVEIIFDYLKTYLPSRFKTFEMYKSNANRNKLLP